MKKFLAFILIFTGISISWTAETFSQKVGVSIDPSRHSVIEELVLKSLVSRAEKEKGIYVFWDDNRDLKEKGIDKLNARVQLMVADSNKVYLIRLLQGKDKEKSPLAQDILVNKDQFISQLEPTLNSLLSQLKKEFPPLEKEKMKEYVVVTKSLSQFESPVPKWELGGNLELISTSIHFSFRYSNTVSSNTDYYYPKINNFLQPAIYLETHYNYRNLFFFGKLGFEMGLGSFHNWGADVNTGLGWGILGSTLVLGIKIHARYFWCTMPIETSLTFGSNSFSITPPDVQYWFFSPGIFMKLNITKNYSIEYHMHPQIKGLENMSIYVYNGQPTISTDYIEPEGPGEQMLRFNFRLNNRLNLFLNYKWKSEKWSTYNNGGNPEPVIYADSQGILTTSELRFRDINIGIGVNYVL